MNSDTTATSTPTIDPHEDGCVELNENDAIETILNAMKNNQRLASVQERACRILGRMSKFKTNNPKRKEIGSAGGILMIVDGMKVHSRDEMVQESGCFVLRWLVFRDDDNRKRVAEAGGVEAVVDAMNKHPSAKLILEHASILLLNLSTHVKEKNRKQSEERTRIIGHAGGVEAVIDVMRRHPTVMLLLKHGCNALKSF